MATNACENAGFILRIVAQLFFYLRIIIPVILIVMIVIDVAKVVVGQADDKVKKDATNKIFKRIIYAIIIFLVPTLVNLFFRAIEDSLKSGGKDGSAATNWVSCWTQYYK